jgi:hypothetical protein
MAGELTRLMGRGQLRVSDEEREETVEALRHHYSAGRITHDEFEDRVESAYHATVRADLDQVMYDLPSQRGRRAAKRLDRANRAAWRAHFTSYVGVNGGMVAIWGMSGGGEFWPVWTIAPWGMAVVWHGLAARAMTGRLRRRGGSGGREDRRPPRAIPR